jgi:signal transduction histidine kinase
VVGLERLGDHADQGQRVHWSVVAPGETAAFALGQRDELREVLINVLENARLAGATEVSLTVTARDAVVVLDIADNGGGIAADVLPHVFEPHFSTRTSGSGLGLAISRRLIEGWGGTIGVTSRIGQGTTVSITLARASAIVPEASEPRPR